MFEKGSITIVYDKKTEAHAHFLMQLIQDKGRHSEALMKAGIEKYKLSAWDISHYENNKATIDIKQWTVFLGTNPTADKHKTGVPIYYRKAHMRYGWRGREAIVYLKEQPQLSRDHIKELSEEYIKYNKNLSGPQPTTLAVPDSFMSDMEKYRKLDDFWNDKPGWFLALTLPLLPPIAIGCGILMDICKMRIDPKAFFTLATAFYTEGLASFLGQAE